MASVQAVSCMKDRYGRDLSFPSRAHIPPPLTLSRYEDCTTPEDWRMVCKGQDNRGCGAAKDAICSRCERHRCERCCLSRVSCYCLEPPGPA
jgi:hypothetical protein